MPRRRQQTARLQEALRLQPRAVPVDLFARPDVQSEAPIPVLNFAGLSQTVAGFLEQRAANKARKSQLAGERFALERPQLVEHLESGAAQIEDAKERKAKAIRDFEFLQRQGIIPPSVNPNWQIGYARGAGRLMAQIYRNNVLGRVNEVAAVNDANGQPLLPTAPESILSEEWEKIVNSPAVQSFYGGQEALRVKEQVDDEFRATAAERRSKALELAHSNNLVREIGGMFDQALLANDVIDSKALQPITDFLTTEVRGHSVLNPREVAFQALKLTFQRLATVDPDSAVRAVYAAQELVVGGVRLGDDRGDVGVSLEQLKKQYQNDSEVHARQQVQTEAARRALAISEAEKDYMPLLVRAKRDGVPLATLARQLGDQYLRDDQENDRFDGYGAFVVDALETFVQQTDRARQSDQNSIQQFHVLLADGKLDDAEALAQASLGTGSLTGEDYLTLKDTLAQRRGSSRFVEQSAIFNGVIGRYGELKPTGYTDEVQQRIDDQVQDLRVRAQRDFLTFVGTTEGQTNREELHRAWLEERWAADRTVIGQLETDTRGKRDGLLQQIRTKFSRFQDAEDLIRQGEAEGSLTQLEAQLQREDNVKAAAGRERFFQSEAYQGALADLENRFQVFTGGQPDQTQLTILSTARQELRDHYAAAVDGILSDPQTDPRAFEGRARVELRRIQNEITDRLFPESARKVTEKAVKAGVSAEAAQQAGALLDNDRKDALAWASVLANPGQRENFSAVHPLIQALRDPALPEEFYRSAAAWVSGLDPIFGRQTTRGDVEAIAFRSLAAAPEALRSGLVQSIIPILGVEPVSVLRDRAMYEPDEEERVQLRKEIDAIETGLRSGLWLHPEERREDADTLRRRLDPVTVDLTDYQYRPLTTPFFRTEAVFKAFRQDPAYPEFLSRIGIDPTNPQEVEEFEINAHASILRINP